MRRPRCKQGLVSCSSSPVVHALCGRHAVPAGLQRAVPEPPTYVELSECFHISFYWQAEKRGVDRYWPLPERHMAGTSRPRFQLTRPTEGLKSWQASNATHLLPSLHLAAERLVRTSFSHHACVLCRRAGHRAGRALDGEDPERPGPSSRACPQGRRTAGVVWVLNTAGLGLAYTWVASHRVPCHAMPCCLGELDLASGWSVDSTRPTDRHLPP